MTNQQVNERLRELGLSKIWLAEAAGYKETTLYNNLGGEEKTLNSRLASAIERAFDEELKLRSVKGSTTDVWDLVTFTAPETIRIDRAKTQGGFGRLEDFYHEAVIYLTDDLLSQRSLPFGGQDTLKVAEESSAYNAEDKGNE